MMGIFDKKKNTSMYKDVTSLQITGMSYMLTLPYRMLLLIFGDKKRFIH